MANPYSERLTESEKKQKVTPEYVKKNARSAGVRKALAKHKTLGDIGNTLDDRTRYKEYLEETYPSWGPEFFAGKRTAEFGEGRKNPWGDALREQGLAKDFRFDPEGKGFDYPRARASGMRPDPKSMHWGSVAELPPDALKELDLPEGSSMVLKGKKHKTWKLMEYVENARGNVITKIGTRYYSIPGGDK